MLFRSPVFEQKKSDNKENVDEQKQNNPMKFDFDLEALTKAVEEEAAATGGGFGTSSSNGWDQ